MKVLLLCLLTAGAAFPATLPAQSVAGDWDATLQTPGGARTYRLVLQVKGDTLTGTIKRPTGDAAIRGNVAGNIVVFSYTINYNGNDLTITVTAKVTGDTMAGTVDFGGGAEDAFSATRVPPGGGSP